MRLLKRALESRERGVVATLQARYPTPDPNPYPDPDPDPNPYPYPWPHLREREPGRVECRGDGDGGADAHLVRLAPHHTVAAQRTWLGVGIG